MLKSQHLMIFSFIVVLSFMYNNCASKMQFATVPVTTETAFGVVPGTTNGEDAVLTFNELNQPATIAFNDNYPGAGDSDYNDFVVNIGVTETYDSSGALSKIVIQYSPKYKVSGADHKLILGFDGRIRGRGNWSSNLNTFTSMPMFEGNAKIDVDVVNINHESIKHESNHQKNMDLVIFDSTGLAMAEKHSAVITITDFDKAMNKFSERGALSIKRYRTVLFNSGYDIDISDIHPSFVDNGGAPVGFFVPVNWHPPKEGQSIFPAYPDFKAHVAYLMGGMSLDVEPVKSKKWFDTVGDMNLVMQ